MSWFNKNEYKTFLKQRLKEEKKRFKVVQTTDIEHNIADIFNMNNNYRNAF